MGYFIHEYDLSQSLKCRLGVWRRVKLLSNIAFQETPAALARLAEQHAHLAVATIAGADHFYNGVREEAWQAIVWWRKAASSFATLSNVGSLTLFVCRRCRDGRG
jgi:hypothetical protein